MAITVAKHFYPDLSSISDPLRFLQTFDYFGNSDQMEFGASSILEQAIDRNNYHPNHNQELDHLVEETIDFGNSADHPADNWASIYAKPINQGTTNDQHQSLKKRRMEWEPLDISNIDDDNKIPIISNVKERERNRKLPSGARLGWTDDIDFDLNTDLTNHSYLNNDSIFSLSSALTALKQETPSPPGAADPAKKKNPITAKELNVIVDDEPSQLNHTAELSKLAAVNGSSGDKLNNISPIINGNAPNDNNQQQKGNSAEKNGSAANQISAQNGNGHADAESADESKFQYILAAATSIATKSNEETITYLNQGQSYEIKLKKLGDLSAYRGKLLKSVIKICFHERRLQYMEREQMQLWQSSRPGERIVEIDVPLSYGLCHAVQPYNLNALNVVEVLWDPMKEVGVYIKINCISTEFTPKKHGGEKGVPFRIQVETYIENMAPPSAAGADTISAIHAAACQIKVFKLKGADRKHKQDREKIQKRPPSEKEKYQPSYECTILNDIPCDSLTTQSSYNPEQMSASASPLMSNSPIHASKFDGIFSNNNSNNGTNPIGINSVSSSNSNVKIVDQNNMSPPTPPNLLNESDELNNSSGYITTANLCKDATPAVLAHWMTANRLGQYASTFAQFTGADVLRMSKDDLIQICGLADGIRMYNTLHSKALAPRLTIYVSFDGSSFHAVYLHTNTTKELAKKLYQLPGFAEYLGNGSGNVDSNSFSAWNLQSKYSGSGSNLWDASKLNVYVNGPAGIHVFVTDEVLANIKDESLFALETQNNKILMKAVYKNEIN